MIEFVTKYLYDILSYCGISKEYYNILSSKTQALILSYIYTKAINNEEIDAYIIRNMII